MVGEEAPAAPSLRHQKPGLEPANPSHPIAPPNLLLHGAMRTRINTPRDPLPRLLPYQTRKACLRVEAWAPHTLRWAEPGGEQQMRSPQRVAR